MLLLIMACAPADSEPVEVLSCSDRLETLISPDELTPGGYAASDVAALLLPHDGPLRWAAGGETTVTLTATPDLATARWVDREQLDESDEIVPSLGCRGGLDLDANLTVRTGDGRLDEVWPVTLRTDDGLGLVGVVTVDPATLVGSYVETAPVLLVDTLWTAAESSGGMSAETAPGVWERRADW